MRRILATVALICAAGLAAAQGTLEDLVVERALLDYGHEIPADSTLRLDGIVPVVADAVMIAEYWMDPRTGRFLANVVPESGPVQRVQGRLRVVVPVPVPVRRILPGEILSAADLRMAELPVGALNGFAQTDPEALVGKQVRRVLSPDRPVMSQSVMTPLAVTRGTRVTIVYREGPMRLSAPGRALADAHLGDEIRVLNLSSNKTISAVARADGVMEVLY